MINNNTKNKTAENVHFFYNKKPEIVFEWADKKTDAIGYLVINSLKNGASGGGTRLHENITLKEVADLAKTMELKFAMTGPNIGGAKSGIKVDPNHPDKLGILRRWYQAIKPFLGTCYGTGSDLNTDMSVIDKILTTYGIDAAQQGIFNALYKNTTDYKVSLKERMSVLHKNITVSASSSIPLSTLITGYGISESVRFFYSESNKSIKNKRVLVMGVGNVGAAAAYYLSQNGAKIIGLYDKDHGIIRNNGVSKKELEHLLLTRSISSVFPDKTTRSIFLNQIKNQQVDIFIPAADSATVRLKFIDDLTSSGLETIACGANNPFFEESTFYSSNTQLIDEKTSLIPDFIANSGMARAFAKILTNDKILGAEIIFKDITEHMQKNINDCLNLSKKNNISASAYYLALNKIDSYSE